MPTYDYHCDSCGHDYEVFQSMTDRNKPRCPKCNSKEVFRKIGAGMPPLFIGDGFHCVDYKAPYKGK